MRSSDNHKARVVLASRKNAGIRVALLWAADTNTVAVLVRDDSMSEQFELLVEPDANPTTSTSTRTRTPPGGALTTGPRAHRRPPEMKETASDMDSAPLATEATGYLDALHVFRSLELDVKWRSEAEELGLPSPALQMRHSPTCGRCGAPLVRINGRHVCLQPSNGPRRSG
jgi:hypothetical protein